MFLRWAKGEGIIKKEEDGDNKMKRKWQQKEEDDFEVRVCPGYQVAKNPGYGNVTVDDLINKFHAVDEYFLWYIEEFLLAHSFPIPPSHNVPFGVFKCLSVTLPQIPQVTDTMDLRDTIRTVFPEPPRNRSKAVQAQFDTVLAFEKAGLKAFSDPLNPLKGACL